MTTFSLPAASLRSASRLPADRMWLWVSKYLVYIVLWVNRRANFRVSSIFLPESRGGLPDRAAPKNSRPTPLCVTIGSPPLSTEEDSHEGRQCRRRNLETRGYRVSDRLPGQPDHRGRGRGRYPHDHGAPGADRAAHVRRYRQGHLRRPYPRLCDAARPRYGERL